MERTKQKWTSKKMMIPAFLINTCCLHFVNKAVCQSTSLSGKYVNFKDILCCLRSGNQILSLFFSSHREITSGKFTSLKTTYCSGEN